MKELPTIEGKNIRLGPFPETEEFYEIYCGWLNSEHVIQGTGGSAHTREEVVEMLREWREDPKNHTFCIFEKDTNEPIGDVGIRQDPYDDYDNEWPEIVIMIARNTGRGRGLEAMTLALDYAFERLGCGAINLCVYKDNATAVRLYKKLGFETIAEKTDAGERAELVMKLAKEKWVAKKLDKIQ